MQKQKTAFITGITGQDGAYLARFLLDRAYCVVGLRQPVAFEDTERLDAFIPDWSTHNNFSLIRGDLTDTGSLVRVLQEWKPDEIYNLAGQSDVAVSFDVPEMTTEVNALGVLRLLDSVRHAGLVSTTKFFQASTSELFGNALAPQNEKTVMVPESPYANAKLYAFHTVRIYREAYGLFATNGIMFNHESPWRGQGFVTKKIVKGLSDILSGAQDKIELGNLDARRDWTHAQDMMRGAWQILQNDVPDDFVLASGRTHTVRDFATQAFAYAGIQLTWAGEGLEEVATDHTGKILVKVNPKYFRPLDVEHLCGDSSKAQRKLGWYPEISFESLIEEMVSEELKAAGISLSKPSLKLYA